MSESLSRLLHVQAHSWMFKPQACTNTFIFMQHFQYLCAQGVCIIHHFHLNLEVQNLYQIDA